MGHITSKSYLKLQKRLDKAPQGVPESENLYKIFKILFTEKEAELLSVLPINFFTPEKAAKLWKKDLDESKKILDELADKGILFDFQSQKRQMYFLAPSMPGFIEFTLMRTDGKFNQKVLSELFYKYINGEGDFTREVLGLKPAVGRTLIQEETIQPKDKSVVLDYEKATEIIESASCIVVGNCYCRHKMHHVGKACDKPLETCMSFNEVAKSLSKHNIARKIDKDEALNILDDCIDKGLMQIGDNIQDQVGFICNCCSCCCEGIQAYKELGYSPKYKSNFISKNPEKNCITCGICVKRCPVDAIEMVEIEGKKKIKINEDVCLGCGLCVKFCPTKNLYMERKKKLEVVPRDSFERIVLSAIETNKLQYILFDKHHLLTHDLLQRFLGIFLGLKPVKQILVKRQVSSRFLNIATRTKIYSLFNELYNKGDRVDYR